MFLNGPSPALIACVIPRTPLHAPVNASQAISADCSPGAQFAVISVAKLRDYRLLRHFANDTPFACRVLRCGERKAREGRDDDG
jgi:hypothetical protein